MFDSITQLIYDVLYGMGYVGLTLLLIVENLFPPVPSEVILPLAGFFVGSGDLNFWGALFASTLGSVLGALALYQIGRSGGRPLVLRYGSFLRIGKEELDRAEGWFDRYGDWVVLFGRIVPFTRSLISVPAGTTRMPLLRFTLLTTIGSAIWNAVLIGAGVILGANWTLVQTWVGSYSNTLLVIAAVAAATLLILWSYRRKT